MGQDKKTNTWTRVRIPEKKASYISSVSSEVGENRRSAAICTSKPEKLVGFTRNRTCATTKNTPFPL